MRINNQIINRIQKLYNKKEPGGKVEGYQAKPGEDGVSISDEARLFSSALKAIQALPETDNKRVDELKTKIKEDSYNVNNEDIAEKVFDEGLF